jgi:hypothetical protein
MASSALYKRGAIACYDKFDLSAEHMDLISLDTFHERPVLIYDRHEGRRRVVSHDGCGAVLPVDRRAEKGTCHDGVTPYLCSQSVAVIDHSPFV